MAVRRLRYEYRKGSSSKFWEIEFGDNSKVFVTYWGRIGTAGMSRAKNFTTVRECNAARGKLIGSKIAKGYSLVGEVVDIESATVREGDVTHAVSVKSIAGMKRQVVEATPPPKRGKVVLPKQDAERARPRRRVRFK